jgi:hypothetical protein
MSYAAESSENQKPKNECCENYFFAKRIELSEYVLNDDS